jgi:hypothetical protein
MGKLLVVVALLFSVTACKPMYGDPAPRLKDPSKKNPPKGWYDEPVTQVTYVEECEVNFSGPPTTKRNTKAAQQKVIAGDSNTLEADTKAALAPNTRVELTKRSLQEYRDALIADPFNAEATLKLALAYDKVLRKGCAIAMLKRLEQLAGNPKFGAEAAKSQVLDNEGWFKPYRKDALKALGY